MQLRVHNGPELISTLLTDWCDDHNIELVYIQLGKPQQNGFERFNGSFRREFLNAYLFESLSQVREMAWFWRLDYNEERTHESLGNLPGKTSLPYEVGSWRPFDLSPYMSVAVII